MKIDILGTEYKIEFRKESEDSRLKNNDGYFDHSSHLLVIDDMTEHKDHPDALNDLNEFRKIVIRHEIVHAFLFESGLFGNSGNVQNWAVSEEIVDWIALQSPKILEAFKQAECL